MNEKSKNYLLYAIGEIILVMLGILLALQVNNWNEERIEKKIERKLLLEMMQDLRATLNELSTDISMNELLISQGNEFIEYVNEGQNEFLSDSVSVYFLWGFSPVFARTVAFNNISTQGINIIKDDSIRLHMAEVYDELMPRIQNNEEYLDYHIRLIEEKTSPFIQFRGDGIRSTTTYNFRKGIRVSEFYDIFTAWTTVHRSRNRVLFLHQGLKSELIALYNRIADYLDYPERIE